MHCYEILRTIAFASVDISRLAATTVRGCFRLTKTIASLKAENLFLSRQLALYREREAPRKPTTPAVRMAMVFLSRLFDWRSALVIVQPDTFVRWHRQGFKMFWRWKSRRGRPSIPPETVDLIRDIVRSNLTRGEGKIAEILQLRLGLCLSPRTVRKYIRDLLPPQRPAGRGDQRWATFVRNHAKAIVATDFFTVVSATFRVYYVLVVMEIGSRRILHFNVTVHPTADWVRQQLRQAIPCDHAYRFLIHDRGSAFSTRVDETIRSLGLRPLKTPYRAPRANAFCERLIGTIRRECLDYLIPLSQNHLRLILKEYVTYYNTARPHSGLGPGIPEPAGGAVQLQPDRHRLPADVRVVKIPILGGLHHDYRLEKVA